MPKKGQDFEDLVARVVAGLNICRKGQVFRNRRYAGVRQPGSYEVDIAIEFTADEALFFLIIVECKNWSKAVDRPIVQKLIQTRDAIGAHKAAIASAVGFTQEARDVARTNGVACWQVSESTFEIIGAIHESRPTPAKPSRPVVTTDSGTKPGAGSGETPITPVNVNVLQRILRDDVMSISQDLKAWLGFPGRLRGAFQRLRNRSETLRSIRREWINGELLRAAIKALAQNPSLNSGLRSWYTATKSITVLSGLSNEGAETFLSAACEEFRSRFYLPKRILDDADLRQDFCREFIDRYKRAIARSLG